MTYQRPQGDAARLTSVGVGAEHPCEQPVTAWAQPGDEHRCGQLAAVPLAYIGVPLLAGTVLGVGLRRGWSIAKIVAGPDPAPRAWDYLFRYHIDGWIRCRLKSGTWLAGAYADANGKRSYAAGYPEPQDLYLAASVEVDAETGEFALDDDGRPQLGLGGLLVRWEEVEYLEFIDP